MPVEVRPKGNDCIIKCRYCYQEPMRMAGGISADYDREKIIEQIEKINQPFHLFGGEALMVPKEDLEFFWDYGFKKFKQNGIQTNGILIDDDHIELFKKYNVHVGISIDGPGELNILRWAGSEDRTNKSTEKTINGIVKCVKNGLSVGVIITLHRANATKDKLPRLLNFIDWLGSIGVKGGNLHVLEVDSTMHGTENILTQEENIEAMITIAKFLSEKPQLHWNPFAEIPDILRGEDEHATCYWRNCDPLNTVAVYGIEGDGALTNCGRTNKEGVSFYKAKDVQYNRYISLYNSPDEMGGCKDCRFWMACGGSCPGEAENYDIRNKTTHCRTQQAILSFYEDVLEAQGIQPITKSEHRGRIERIMLDRFSKGQPCSIKFARNVIAKMERGRGNNAVVVPVKE